MTFADVNGQRIFYRDTGGRGPAVILAHGFLMDSSMFDAQVNALSDKYRVITWDERGFGQTEYDGKPFTYWDSANDCLALMTHLGIDSAVVGGMSQGGFLSLRAALTAPERVRALVLIDTAADNDSPEILAGYRHMVDTWVTHGAVDELANIIANIIIADPQENPKWITKWKAQPKDFLVHPAGCLLDRDDISPRLAEISCPALVVHGSNDTAISADRAKALHKGLRGAEPIVWVEGAAHAANLTHPSVVNPALRAFLDRVA